MKIVMTGGGTGGHFYPLLAVADSIHDIAKREHLVTPKVWLVSSEPYDKGLLYEHDLTGVVIPTGKRRIYASAQNVLDIFKTGPAILRALLFLFRVYPDVVFAKGGYASFPILVAARFFRIPVFIHESDTVPGRVNQWAAKFAKHIAVSYPEAAKQFPGKEKLAVWTGNPIRRSIAHPIAEGAHEKLNLEKGVPVVLIVGGSQGAQRINETILDALPTLLSKCQVIHQVGKENYTAFTELSSVAIQNHPNANRYHPFANLDDATLSAAAAAATLVVTRAGSALFEIAAWGLPSIVIPITDSNGDHQRQNAYTYARTGAAEVIEEANLTPHILAAEIIRLAEDQVALHTMRQGAQNFARLDAADVIAKELIAVCLEHEK